MTQECPFKPAITNKGKAVRRNSTDVCEDLYERRLDHENTIKEEKEKELKNMPFKPKTNDYKGKNKEYTKKPVFERIIEKVFIFL